MLKRILALTIAVFLIISIAAGAATWKVDPVHSSVGFKVRHLVVAKTSGEFTDFEGTIEFDGKDLASGSVSLSINVASVNTDNEKRDNHLRSPDFFDAEKFPTMTFVSTSVILGEGDKFQLVGNMTIKDVTKEVTFDCEFYGAMNDPWGNQRAGFAASTTIDRQEFNVSYNKAIETGGLIAGNEVEIFLEVEAISPLEQEG